MLKSATSHVAHLLVEAVLGVLGVLALAGCLFAWRLAQGPIDITWLARREQHYLTGPGAHLSIGGAALAWEGFVDPGSPVDVRWRDVTVTAADGTVLAQLPQGRVDLSAARLVFGVVALRAVEIDGAAMALVRRANGGFGIDLAPQAPAAPAGKASGTEGAERLLRELTGSGKGADLPFLAQLRRIRVRQASVSLRDEALGVTWRARAGTIDLARAADGGLDGQAVLDLAAGAARTTLTAHATLTTEGTRITAQSTAVSPAALARAVPDFAPAAAVDLPVQCQVEARLSPDFTVTNATLSVQAGAGTVRAGKGSVALRAVSLVLQMRPDGALAQHMRIDFQPAPGSRVPPPVITGSATARRDKGRIKADFAVDIDRAAFADLPVYWPAGTGGGTRPWIVANIPTGMARDGHVRGSIEAPADFSDATLTALSGGLDATDLSMTWLKPVPGLVHANAKLTIQGPNRLLIEVPQAVQQVQDVDGRPSGGLAVRGGSIEVTGLLDKDQFGDIKLHASGALPDVLTLLNHPRLKLLSRRPIPMANPAGRADIDLRVKLPLDARITLDDIAINGQAHLTGVHLGGVAAGRDLDHGMLDLNVDPNALHITGTGEVAAIPVTLGVDMDFRDGPRDQVLDHYFAHGTATPAALAGSGLPAGVLTGGTAGVSVDYTDRRDGSGTVGIDMDLRQAAVMTPLGWQKAAGPDANASAQLGLTKGRITSIDRLFANGPGLVVRSHALIRPGEGMVLQLDRVELGRTRAHGAIGLPRGAHDPLQVTLRGPALDISAFLAKRGGSRAADDGKPGQRWVADLVFDRVILGKDETLAPVNVQAASDGLRISRADVTAGTKGEVRATIVPGPGGRTLSVDSADAGAVLLAAGIADNIRGGKLRVDGFYNDALPHSPLKGMATLAKFRVTDAPAIGRLLKAMTLYGAIDLLHGPGLGFARMEAPFTYVQQVLTLNGARAFSSSLGITAQGTIDLLGHTADVTGTIVPAYFFNELPGLIPVVGKLFSPEKGGGVFAARYSVRGRLADPKVGVNPLSALTPGFLRGLFGLFK